MDWLEEGGGGVAEVRQMNKVCVSPNVPSVFLRVSCGTDLREREYPGGRDALHTKREIGLQ